MIVRKIGYDLIGARIFYDRTERYFHDRIRPIGTVHLLDLAVPSVRRVHMFLITQI